MRQEGLEPSLRCRKQILSLSCLPVPPPALDQSTPLKDACCLLEPIAVRQIRYAPGDLGRLSLLPLACWLDISTLIVSESIALVQDVLAFGVRLPDLVVS